MLLEMISRARSASGAYRLAWTTILLVAALLAATAPRAFGQQCPFATCGDGSDGILNYTGQSGTVSFDPVALGLHGSGDAFCVYNFKSITIPAGLTVQLSANKVNCPIYWLSQGDVNIAGVLSLIGTNGTTTLSTALRVPTVPGSGGFAGGVGGNSTTNQSATAGSGPGGGAAATISGSPPIGGTFTGNHFLVPLIGGSGGGATYSATQFGTGGGGGGGAILIASSTQIAVPGTISADGGNAYAGCGSGGAIRLVSKTVTVSGTLSALGYFNTGGSFAGTNGQIRLEATTINFTGSLSDSGPCCTPLAESNPLPLMVPTTKQPSIQVTKINGISITENPFGFPDIPINTSSPVPVVITAHQVPVGTVPTVYIFSETQDQLALPCPGGLTGTLATSTCTMNIKYPPADSRGFVKATWSATPP